MNKQISNSMSIENDPKFEVNITLCGVCLNCGNNNDCKAKGTKNLNCKYGKTYKCDKFIPNKEHIFFNKIESKIKDAK